MSATLDVRLYSDYFGGAPAVAVAGRSYPVEILYTTEGQTDYVQAAVTAVLQIHADEAPGDILAFLTGQDDIEAAVSAIEARARALPASAGAILPLPLYAALPPARQLDALRPAPPGTRKVHPDATSPTMHRDHLPNEAASLFGRRSSRRMSRRPP